MDTDPVVDELDAVLRELDADGEYLDPRLADEVELAADAIAEAYVKMREAKMK